MRDDLIKSAVAFLRDPQVQQSPLTKRIAFLEGKGLTSDEIQHALSQTGVPNESASPSPSTSSKSAQPASFSLWQWTWTALVTSAVTLSGYHLIQQALQEWFPSTQRLNDQAEALDSSLLDATNVLRDVQTRLETTHDASATQRTALDALMEEVRSALNEVRDKQQRYQQDMDAMMTDVQTLKTAVPELLEKVKETQMKMLQDVSGELKSLKTLMVSSSKTPLTAKEE